MLQIKKNFTRYARFESRNVKIGTVKIGHSHPVRIQSMADRNTNNTEASLSQAMRMIQAGAELVRFTTQGKKEVESLGRIRTKLHEMGYDTPLVADVHFNPAVAEKAAQVVEKVRINPGNYADRRAKFEKVEFSVEEYLEETERIHQRLLPLIKRCRKHKTAIRVGVNHGSLSDRIMSRYGNTPEGMVESAMEFLRIFRSEQFHEVVISMKASNTRVMIQANRLLVDQMIKEGMDYPLHLGVTEAGEGEDARIKSAVGTGALLVDGIGDTIRVSLTEKPENEMPVAKKIIAHIDRNYKRTIPVEEQQMMFNPLDIHKASSSPGEAFGGKQDPVVITNLSPMEPEHLSGKIPPESLMKKIGGKDQLPDMVYVEQGELIPRLPEDFVYITPHENWDPAYRNVYPLFSLSGYLMAGEHSGRMNFVVITLADMKNDLIVALKHREHVVLVLNNNTPSIYREYRLVFNYLQQVGLDYPVIIQAGYKQVSPDDFPVQAAIDTGTLFADGFGDGIWLSGPNAMPAHSVTATAFSILQAGRARISKTEFISCPGCGRTLFNLQETAARIRARTGHLKGLKIGIMGCIVNGPGEMADADYGYVGAGPGKISLYKNRELVRRNVPEAEAVEELVRLIQNSGDWKPQ